MTRQYRVLPAADHDLDRQAEYLAREATLETALRFCDAARSTFERIAETPSIGERRESVNPRLAGMRVRRVDGFEKHLVFYRVADDAVDVIRILHGARDIEEVLDEE
jgi:toxin ParE1/3/4